MIDVGVLGIRWKQKVNDENEPISLPVLQFTRIDYEYRDDEYDWEDVPVYETRKDSEG